VVVIGDAGGGSDGRPVCVPAFGGRGGIPKSIDKIEEGGASSAPLKLGAGGASSEPLKLGAGGGISKSMEKIGEAGAKSTPVKLGAAGDGDGSLDRVVSIGRSRLRVDHLGQFYVLDSEDEGTDAEVGTVVDPAREVAKVMDPPRASPTVADLPAKVGTSGAPVVEGTTVQAAVDVPVGAATADELHPEVDQLFKVLLAGMDPIFHETYVSFLKICLPAYFRP
jgi:hypothetical protein